jgi:uncharacterized protein
MLIYSYDHLTKDLEQIVSHLKHKNFRPDLIVGIKRGGLIPAVHLSHTFDVRMECIAWSTRDHVQREHNMVVSEAVDMGHNVVFVDDINDSGLTMSQLKEHYVGQRNANVVFTTLITKLDSQFTVDYAPFTLADDRWVVFPWEKNDR